MATLQAIHAGWVIPVEPHGAVLEKHTVVVENALIRAIVPTTEWRPDGTTELIEIDCREHALIPGLINAHTHAGMSLFRGLADDRPLMEWLEQHIWPAEAEFVGRSFVRDGTRLAASEMLRGGTTCFNDMYFFGDEAAAAAIETGIRAVIGMIVIGFPSAWAGTIDDYFRNGQQIHDQYRDHPLVTTSFAPHAPYTVDDAALLRIATLAEELDLPIHMHLHETADEVERAVASNGASPLRRLEGLGLLSPRLQAVHMTALTDDEITAVAHAGVNVVHCPESNLKLASGFCPVAKLLSAGINVALGTDGAASNNDLDMFGELRTAALLAKGVAGDASALPAASALRMATINGAKALGLEQQIGSISVGKLADLVAVDMSQPDTQPLYEPISQLVYAAHRSLVREVWVGGRHVVRGGQLVSVDVMQVVENARQWRDRIAPPHILTILQNKSAVRSAS